MQIDTVVGWGAGRGERAASETNAPHSAPSSWRARALPAAAYHFSLFALLASVVACELCAVANSVYNSRYL